MKSFVILLLTIALAFMTWVNLQTPTPTFMCYEDQYKVTDINGREFCMNKDKVGFNE